MKVFTIIVPTRSRNRLYGERTKKFLSNDPNKLKYLAITIDILRSQGNSAQWVIDWFKAKGLSREYNQIATSPQYAKLAGLTKES